jgi:hypothetical protein
MKKISHLIDSFDDESFCLYQLQKERLLEGITLDYSFVKMNPFNGINRKNNELFLSDETVDTGLYSFLFNTNLFSIINIDAKVLYFDMIALFTDEIYNIQVISGEYKSKIISTKIRDLINTSMFEDDELIMSLVKNKRLKINIQLKEPGKNRKIMEEKINLENIDIHAEEMLSNFLKKISDRQLEKDQQIYKYLNLLNVWHQDSQSKEELINKFKNLSLKDIRIKKDVLYMNLLFNNVNNYTRLQDLDIIIDKAQMKYDSIKKNMKVLESKLKNKYITIKDR